MNSFQKPCVAAGLPTIIATVLLASALSAAELVRNGQDTTHSNAVHSAPVLQDKSKAYEKDDLEVDLSQVKDRPIRCVSRATETTCTGWPVGPGLIALNN